MERTLKIYINLLYNRYIVLFIKLIIQNLIPIRIIYLIIHYLRFILKLDAILYNKCLPLKEI